MRKNDEKTTKTKNEERTKTKNNPLGQVLKDGLEPRRVPPGQRLLERPPLLQRLQKCRDNQGISRLQPPVQGLAVAELSEGVIVGCQSLDLDGFHLIIGRVRSSKRKMEEGLYEVVF